MHLSVRKGIKNKNVKYFDGGIKYSGDLAAFAAGADAVMIGSLFAEQMKLQENNKK